MSELRFFNRELAWLAFNQQVLQEAVDEKVPLLERMRFLSIVANNLDEFFMVRVAGLKSDVDEGKGRPCPAGMSPQSQLAAISDAAHEHVRRTYECAINSVLPALEEHGIRLAAWDEATVAQQAHLSEMFHENIFPVLTPLAIDTAHPFPILQNLSVNLAVLLEPANGEDEQRLAIVQIPAGIQRFVSIPGSETHHYILLEEIVQAHLKPLFVGQQILDSAVFRITRDSELDFDGDAQSFLAAIESELQKRLTNNPVRIEVDAGIATEFLDLLKRTIKLPDQDIYLINGPLDLSSFSFLPDMDGFESIHYEPLPPQMRNEFEDADDIWSLIRNEDILLHHPYDSFDPVVELIETAASDPDVLAIKQTLYRTSRDSPIVAALTEAAQNGKQVCVLIELMARFDEERNIEGARSLKDAGAHVIEGIVGLKTHSKICLIVRREPDGIRRYVHLGTGNYNEMTARLYTDFGLMTVDDNIGADASNFFNALTGYSDVPTFRQFIMAPHDLRDRSVSLIHRETRRAEHGQQANITAKMNSLADPEIIAALYEASQAGVRIRLNVRGICCLRPGIKGLSENITVISIIDRFLEHARIYHFYNGGEEEIYLASADWMPRNLDRRIELMFPVLDKNVCDQISENLEVYFQDNSKARVLQPDGSYSRRKPSPGESVRRSQNDFYNFAKESRRKKTAKPPVQFVPREG